MGIEESDKIDIVGKNKSTGQLTLFISDHLDWQDEEAHLIALQDKINTYIAYIESGQVWERYPEATGSEMKIEVVGKYSLPEIGEEFIRVANATLATLNCALVYTLLDDFC